MDLVQTDTDHKAMMKKIINLTIDDISGLQGLGISHILAEVSLFGEVIREIGFDVNDKPLYKHPGEGKFGKFGLLDNQTIEVSGFNSDISTYNFDEIFSSID